MSCRGKLLALIAPGAIAINVSATPWAVEASTTIRSPANPQMASAVPGCSSSRIDRLVQAPPAPGYFSTKARSIT